MTELITLISILGSLLFVLVLPGLCLSFLFYNRRSKLNLLERGILSCGLSMSVVPILLYTLSYIGIGISKFSALTILIVFDILIVGIYLYKTREEGRVI